jgi:hypothetical protein
VPTQKLPDDDCEAQQADGTQSGSVGVQRSRLRTSNRFRDSGVFIYLALVSFEQRCTGRENRGKGQEKTA